MEKSLAQTLDSQLEYYRCRAGEFEQFYTREGRYDRGAELNEQFISELRELSDFVSSAQHLGDVLELASGTGYWTRRLVPNATDITAVDGAPEMLELARSQLEAAPIEWIHANLFEWNPTKTYDTVFFGFWLSHVPPEKFEEFWSKIARAIKPGGRVLLVDSRFDPTSTAKDHVLNDADATRVTRKLNDGRTYEIVKIFHRPEVLAARLQELGWTFSFRATSRYFFYGSGELTRG